MILPNVFQKHNIEYLSASTINTWVEQPALALLKIAGIKDKVAGPSAWRGIAVDEALTGIIFNEDYTEYSKIDAFSIGERIRDIEYYPNGNFYVLVFETTPAFGILKDY